MRVLPVTFIKPHISVFRENSDVRLTVFLDFFLTKYFCKRDVNEC